MNTTHRLRLLVVCSMCAVGAALCISGEADARLKRMRRWCVPCDDHGMTIPSDFLNALDSKAQADLRDLLKSERDRREFARDKTTTQLGSTKDELQRSGQNLASGRQDLSMAESTLNSNQGKHETAVVTEGQKREASGKAASVVETTKKDATTAFVGVKTEIAAAQVAATNQLESDRAAASAANTAGTQARNETAAATKDLKDTRTALNDLREKLNSAQKAVDIAQKEVERCQDVVNDAGAVLSDLAKSVINAAQGKIDDARNDLKNARDALDRAKKAAGEKKGLLKVAQDAYVAGENEVRRAGDRLEKARADLAEAGNKAVAAAKKFDAQKELTALRNRTVEDMTKTPDEWIKFIKDAGTAGERALLPVVQAYHDAVDAASTASTELVKAKEEVADTLHKVEESRVVKDIKREAVGAREQVVQQGEKAVKAVEKTAGDAVNAVKEAVAFLADQEVIPFQIDTPLEFTINTHTGTMHGKLDLSFAGASLDSDQIKDLMQGQVSVPEFNPIQLAATCLASKLTIDDQGYFDTRDSKVKSSAPTGVERATTDSVVYVASKRFVDWAEGATVARMIATSILDGGTSAKEEIKRQLLLEYGDISTWAKLQGQSLSDDFAAEMFLALIEGRSPTLPGISFDAQTVHYGFNLEPFGSSFLPKPLRDKAESLSTKVTERVNALTESRKTGFLFDHAGFSITISNLPPQSLDERIVNFEKAFLSGDQSTRQQATIVFRILAPKIKDAKIRAIVSELVKTLEQGGGGDIDLLKSLPQLVAFKRQDLQSAFVPGRRIIDLTPTQPAKNAESVFARCAMGNKGGATIQKLEFDLVTYTLYGRVNIHHCHSWGKLKDLLGL